MRWPTTLIYRTTTMYAEIGYTSYFAAALIQYGPWPGTKMTLFKKPTNGLGYNFFRADNYQGLGYAVKALPTVLSLVPSNFT